MSWLITGGAGYIGSHVVTSMTAAGFTPVVFDDLSSGRREFVPEQVPFIHGSVLDEALLTTTMREHRIDGVIHLAGFKYAGESVRQPLLTYAQNVEGTRSVLAAMQAADVTRIVFSSSAAVYGTPDVPLVTEDLPKNPSSPYGESKLIGEWLIRDQARAMEAADRDFQHTSLRYFNVVGSDGTSFDVSPHNLFPIVFEALLNHRLPVINGDDYDTPDGTNVRDYVHVADIAKAHVAAAKRMIDAQPLEAAYNLGSMNGLSVRQIMDAIAAETGIDFIPAIGPRREGDPDRIVATGVLAAIDLDWKMRHTVEEMVRSGWQARVNHPCRTNTELA